MVGRSPTSGSFQELDGFPATPNAVTLNVGYNFMVEYGIARCQTSVKSVWLHARISTGRRESTAVKKGGGTARGCWPTPMDKAEWSMIMDRKKTVIPEQPTTAGPSFWARQASRDMFVQETTIVPQVGRDDRPPRQRVGIRKAVPCSILVKTGSSYVLARKIHDISLVGAYVEMDSAGLVPGDIVDIVIDFAYGQRQVEHQISAEVVRVETDGAGFRFCTYGNRTYTDFVNLLYAM